MKDIRLTLKEIVKKRGPIRKVAEEVCIDHANLIRLMREGSDPRLKTIERIVDGLGYSLTLKKKEVKPGKAAQSKLRRVRKERG